MNEKPYFSVVMPTRNRCELLPTAIQAVLKQSFTDLELIVSDNFSSDNTKQVVEGFEDPRIKYFRSEKPLSMGESYDLALSHATGEYFAFCSDDDAYMPLLLDQVKRVIDEHRAQVVAFRLALYYQKGDFEHNRSIVANTLAVPFHTGKVTKFDPATALSQLYGLFGLCDLPIDNAFIPTYVNNAVYHHSVFSRIKSIRKSIFTFTPADMYLAAAIYFVIDAYHCLDMPLYVWSNWDGNATASVHKKGNELMVHYEKLLDGKQLTLSPLKFALPLNCCVDAILHAGRDFNNPDVEPDIDWALYYKTAYDHLLFLKNAKIDVSRELSQFNEVLATEPVELRQNVASSINNFRFVSKQLLRKVPFAVRLAKKVLRRGTAEDMTFINGDVEGFDTTLSAADFLSTHIEANE